MVIVLSRCTPIGNKGYLLLSMQTVFASRFPPWMSLEIGSLQLNQHPVPMPEVKRKRFNNRNVKQKLLHHKKI